MLRVIREMQIKTTMRYYLKPVRMPIIHKKQIQHVFTQMGKKNYCWWECNMVTVQFSSVAQFCLTLHDHSSKASILRCSAFFISNTHIHI